MLRLLKILLLVLAAHICFGQAPRAISFAPNGTYSKDRGRIEDSILRTPVLNLWYSLYNTQDSAGLIWYWPNQSAFAGKWGTVTRLFASQDWVSTNYATITGSANYIQNQTSSPQAGSGLHTAGNAYVIGRVGIGSASPSYKLGIRDTSSILYSPTSSTNNRPVGVGINVFNATMAGGIGNYYIFSGQDAANESQQVFMGLVTAYSGNTPQFIVGHSTGNNNYTERLRLDSAGNFGIGTTQPTNKVHINGNFRIQDGAPGLNKVWQDTTSTGIGAWRMLPSIPLKDFYTDVGNTSTTAGTYNAIFTFSLPANALFAVGQKISARYGGRYSVNANSKGLAIVVNGVQIGASTSSPSTPGWQVNVTMIRTGASTARVSFQSDVNAEQADLTGLNFGSTIQFDLWGAGGGAANDVVGKQGNIQWMSAAP